MADVLFDRGSMLPAISSIMPVGACVPDKMDVKSTPSSLIDLTPNLQEPLTGVERGQTRGTVFHVK